MPASRRNEPGGGLTRPQACLPDIERGDAFRLEETRKSFVKWGVPGFKANPGPAVCLWSADAAERAANAPYFRVSASTRRPFYGL